MLGLCQEQSRCSSFAYGLLLRRFVGWKEVERIECCFLVVTVEMNDVRCRTTRLGFIRVTVIIRDPMNSEQKRKITLSWVAQSSC